MIFNEICHASTETECLLNEKKTLGFLPFHYTPNSCYQFYIFSFFFTIFNLQQYIYVSVYILECILFTKNFATNTWYVYLNVVGKKSKVKVVFSDLEVYPVNRIYLQNTMNRYFFCLNI